MPSRASTAFVLGLMLTAGGCGATQRPTGPTARLEGAVTLDGKPVDGGSIQFVPQGQSEAEAVNAPILGGRYVAPKVPQGKVLAIIHMDPPAPPAVVSSDYKPPATVVIPDRYKKGLALEVKADKSDEDIAMSSK